MILGLLVPAVKPLANVVPLVYLLVERARMGRSWKEIGINPQSFRKDFTGNWHLVLLVGVLLQVLLPAVAKFWWPELLEHIRERVPMLAPLSFGTLLATIVVVAFIEELIYRGLLQVRDLRRPGSFYDCQASI
jgi:membrane protease YdiL (CAAX protease family)